ncbi:STAS domain-containing protein [Dactylosporangium sp. AC04546]|uniref:STAS domain-containing protein n=1 Tax=Dactylosporangium sp. AC04546 TaxID=2862460 RepID=UPI001EDF7691|nr:STAS domain-containing protein [Dactylosporangium sp. AC04546]WVK80001.1 STAS domain-containing protein [Dactylosporangium sp. AC04546]
MTASTTIDGTDFGLVCDTCGQSVTGLGATMHNWDLVWSLFSRHGWTGTRLATGPHSCARCSRVPLAAAAAAVPAQPTGILDALDERVSVRTARGVAVVALTGDLTASVHDALQAALAEAGSVPPHLVIDLTRATSLDTSTLGELVAARHRAAQAGGHACLAGMSPGVRRILHTLCLQHLFAEFPAPEAAVAWLHGEPVLSAGGPAGPAHA